MELGTHVEMHEVRTILTDSVSGRENLDPFPISWTQPFSPPLGDWDPGVKGRHPGTDLGS